MSNAKIWDALAKTDPAHTKRFKRAGGFHGTATKPIYADKKMTDLFGSCGIGWGYTEPKYQLVNGPEGEVAVYCWVGVWYVVDGARSEPVWGVGGDFAIGKNKYGLTADDEAFKKAFTDALGNATKHLGMAADVHMGLHDDDKYVAALRDELATPQITPAEFAEGVRLAMRNAQNLQGLAATWKANAAGLATLKADEPGLYDALVAEKDARKDELTPKAAE